jgi:hypothetical protein
MKKSDEISGTRVLQWSHFDDQVSICNMKVMQVEFVCKICREWETRTGREGILQVYFCSVGLLGVGLVRTFSALGQVAIKP